LNLPEGTWMISMKVNNDEVWNDYVKTGRVKGFSIEGYFADALERPKEQVEASESLEALSAMEEFLNAVGDTDLSALELCAGIEWAISKVKK